MTSDGRRRAFSSSMNLSSKRTDDPYPQRPVSRHRRGPLAPAFTARLSRAMIRRLALAALSFAALAVAGCQPSPREPFTAQQLAQAGPDYRYDFSSQGARDRFAADTRQAA